MKLSLLLIRYLAILIFIIGTLTGLLLFGYTVWGDFEATIYDSLIQKEGQIRISCPVIINQEESGFVGVKIKNSTDDLIRYRVWTKITDGAISLIEEYRERYDLQPGEEKTLEWEVDAENAVYGGRLILAKIRTDPTYPQIDREGACGIIVVDTSRYSGNQIVVFAFIVSVLFMATGIAIWWRINKPLKNKNYLIYRAMISLGVIILLGLITSLLGFWLVGGVLLVISILIIGAMLAYFLIS